MPRRRLTAFLAGRLVEAFLRGDSFAGIDGYWGLRKGTAAAVFRRYVRRRRKRGDREP